MSDIAKFDFDAMTEQAELVGNPRERQNAIDGVAALKTLIGVAKKLPSKERLKLVNDFWNNRISYMYDSEVWNDKVDYWATPLELLTKGRGDCEDYAIAKYATLIAAGEPEDNLRIAHVDVPTRNGASPIAKHMVLLHTAKKGMEPNVLDNGNPDILQLRNTVIVKVNRTFNEKDTDQLKPFEQNHWADLQRRAMSDNKKESGGMMLPPLAARVYNPGMEDMLRRLEGRRATTPSATVSQAAIEPVGQNVFVQSAENPTETSEKRASLALK